MIPQEIENQFFSVSWRPQMLFHFLFQESSNMRNIINLAQTSFPNSFQINIWFRLLASMNTWYLINKTITKCKQHVICIPDFKNFLMALTFTCDTDTRI